MKKYILMAVLIAGNWGGRLEAMQRSNENEEVVLKKVILNSLLDDTQSGNKIKELFKFSIIKIMSLNSQYQEKYINILYGYKSYNNVINVFIENLLASSLSEKEKMNIQSQFSSVNNNLKNIGEYIEVNRTKSEFWKEKEFTSKLDALLLSIKQCEGYINNSQVMVDEKKLKSNSFFPQSNSLQNQIINKQNNQLANWRQNIIDAIDDFISKDIKSSDSDQLQIICKKIVPIILTACYTSSIESSDQQLCNKSIKEDVIFCCQKWMSEVIKDLNKATQFEQSIYTVKGCYVSDYLKSLKTEIEKIFESHGQRQLPL